MNVDVLIVYEHKVRELESALLLEKKLNEKGISTKIVQVFWNEGLAHLTVRPKLIVVPWCYDDSDVDYFLTYKPYNKNGKLKIINLHCEQISNKDAVKLMLPSGKAKNIYHFVWGDYFKNMLLEDGVKEELVMVTGSPRLDFFRPEYKKLSKNKKDLSEKYNISCKKKWILIIGNFSYAECSNPDIEMIEQKGYKNFRAMAELSTDTYNAVMEWIELICNNKQIKNIVEFIYRPHPSELESEVLNKIKKNFAHFHVIRDFAVRDWIVNCDMAFSWCSTSAVEVFAAGIPMFNLRPYEIPKEFQFPLLEEIEQISDYNSFAEHILMCACSDNHLYNVNLNFKDSSEFYYSTKKGASVNQMVKFISENINSDNAAFNSIYSSRFALKKLLNYIGKKILWPFHKHIKSSNYKKIYGGYVSGKEMKLQKKLIEEL